MSRLPVVLIAIKGLGIGGAEKLISEAAPLWDRSAFDYRVGYFLPWKDQLVRELESHGVDVVLLGGARGMDLGSARRLRETIRRQHVDLLHVHSPAVGVLARLAAPVPIVYTEHNVADSYREPTRTLNRLTYGRNDAVIAVSDAVATSVERFPGPNARVIRNGVVCHVSDDERTTVRDELQVGERPLVVHVGNIRPHKGHRNLIAAAERIVDELPDVLIVSIGVEKNPGDLQALVDETESRGLSANLRFMGRRTDARAFLAAADVVVNPSDVEGLPIVVLEAMALARPIVATSVGGVPTVIRNNETGLLVSAGDPAGLADGVVRLLRDPALGGTLGDEARSLVDREFSLEAMVRDVETVYRQVLHG